MARIGDIPSMPKRKLKPDANTTIVRAAERALDIKPMRGEELLPLRLAKKLREAKVNLRRSKPKA